MAGSARTRPWKEHRSDPVRLKELNASELEKTRLEKKKKLSKKNKKKKKKIRKRRASVGKKKKKKKKKKTK